MMFVQSGGCCAGSTPMCFPDGEFLVSDRDVLFGRVAGCPIYMDARPADRTSGQPYRNNEIVTHVNGTVGTRPARVRTRIVGAVLIGVIGLLNFHIPHFLVQAPDAGGLGGRVVEAVLAVNVLLAVGSGVGIARNRRWGWVLGIVVSIVSALLWLAQETVGLPGLPRSWTEPSRLVCLALEVGYTVLAGRQLSGVDRKAAS